MKKFFILLFFSIALLSYSAAFAVEVAPRISDREIIEGLADIRGDIKKLEVEVKGDIKKLEVEVKGDIKELRAEINAVRAEIKAVDKRFDAVDKRFDDMNSRFDDLRWMFSIFITISIVILGFVLRMQWQMHKKQTQVETILETQKDELAFLKRLIEKFLPPKGTL
ncbi:MAG: hypothetical protein A2Z57_03080 [Planctomycetes bacterium RIFCSPHIGHO2_12_39_6]|nr:MAG: hypothetical protein A2Z57_03080 [Planctomycetes bacterium RIFCSPHIGHO2_12_39_6]